MGSYTPKASDFYKRKRDERPKAPDELRSDAERDYDRVLYSSAFRRLAGVTQVVGAHESHVFHNRLTHSLRVSQLARRLCEKFERSNPHIAAELAIDHNVAEAAGLAHDLGHPPFGHISEQVLDKLVTEECNVPDGYEGNAQSFRIVNKLALREPTSDPDQLNGLNLTAATLDGILKYPWHRDHNDDKRKYKWGAYLDETAELNFARGARTKGDVQRSAEAEIMDWADDVTYAVHDVEDFYRAGMIPLERLASDKDDSERLRFFKSIEDIPALRKRIGGNLTQEYRDDFTEAVTTFPSDERYTGTTRQRALLRHFISVQIGQYVDAFDLQNTTVSFAKIDDKRRRQVDMLKLLTWHYVIYNPALASQQEGQRKIIRILFETFYAAGTDKSGDKLAIIPLTLRHEIQAADKLGSRVARLVADLVSGLTERQAINLYRRITGIEMGSVLEDMGR